MVSHCPATPDWLSTPINCRYRCSISLLRFSSSRPFLFELIIFGNGYPTSRRRRKNFFSGGSTLSLCFFLHRPFLLELIFFGNRHPMNHNIKFFSAPRRDCQKARQSCRGERKKFARPPAQKKIAPKFLNHL